MEAILQYIASQLSEYGAFGLIITVLCLWVFFREKQFFSLKEKLIEHPLASPEKTKEALQPIINSFAEAEKQIKELREETKILKDSTDEVKKAFDGNKKLSRETLKAIEDVSELIVREQKNSDKIEFLSTQISSLNKERIDELKKIIDNYNNVLRETLLTLQQIKFLLNESED